MRSKILIITALLFASFVPAWAQQALVVEAKMDSSVLWMGEQTVIHLSLTQDANQQVVFPEIVASSELVKGVEVLDISQPDTTELKNDRLQIKQDVLVTSFDSGFYYIPPFKYVLDEDTFATESLGLKIVPVDIAPEATAADAKDIKGVATPPFVLWDFMPTWVWVLLLVCALIAVAVVLVLKFYKPKHALATEDVVEQIPPYELAIQGLQELRDSKLWQQGQEKQYYTRLVDILREYIDSRFGINAMEMTSAEIIHALKQNSDMREVNSYLNDILSMADFVKFAKMRPLPDDNERVMRRAFDFVELTRPQPSVETDDTTNEKNDKSNQ